MQRRGKRGSTGAHERVYLQLYPSPLTSASRMFKIGRSVYGSGLFDEVQLVGTSAEGLPRREVLAPGLSVIRLQGNRGTGNVNRLFRVLLWQPRVFLHFWRRRVDVVAVHNVWLLPMCWLLSRSTGAQLVYNAHELETETYRMTGLKQFVAKRIERTLITRCAVVSVVNSSIADWYAEEYPIPRPVVVNNVPEVKDADVGMRARLGVRDDEMLYIHTGNLVEARNIPLILREFSTSAHHVVFLGDGRLRGDVERAAAAHPNIHWIPPVPHELIVAHTREADVGLCLIEYHGMSDRLSSANKLLEAHTAGIPALCSDLIEARRLLGTSADSWILMDPGGELADALRRIGKEDVARFKQQWSGPMAWADEVGRLLQAYRGIPGVRSKAPSTADQRD